MKKLLVALVTTGMLVGCSSDPKKEQVKQVSFDCVFPNTNVAAPGWICDEPVDGIEVSALGIAEPSKAGITYMKDIAVADARGRLAEEMKITVSKMVKSYLGTTGVGTTETVDAAASSTIKTISSETLVGSKIIRSRTGPNGKFYALVGMNAENFKQSVKKAVNSSMKNDSAQWQQFKAQQSQDELAAGIVNQ
ncbi:MAG TPA: hypothetical protein DD716_01145 [Thiomicrospira sp.]|jgi:hypothetical protein|nr:hypothetical protein [Thiomicrospira sp.]